MKKIICKKVGKNVSISLNSEYDVFEETEKKYSIINDKGIQKNYCKSLFDVVEEQEELAPVVLTNLITELNVSISSLNLAQNRINTSLNITSNDQFINFTQSFTTRWNDSSISCGIKQLYDITNIFEALNNLKTQIENSLNDNLILSEDINLDNLFLDICNSVFQDIFDCINTTLLLFSINTNFRSLKPEYIEVLNSLSKTNITTINENSGNEIVLWVVDTTE